MNVLWKNRAAPGLDGGLRRYRHVTPAGWATVHLRPTPDRGAELFINANQVYRLNPTAAEMAAIALEGIPEPEAIRRLSRRYQAPEKQLADDYRDFVLGLNELLDPTGACPVHDLELEITPPFGAMPPAPYRMDLAITYRCNDDCAHCYNARPRTYPEMETARWREVLDRLWAIGIPHICFTGGEATLRLDLPELVSYSHDLGHVVGLLSNGRRLSDPGYTRSLVAAGLDHVQITLESHREEIHDQMVRTRGAWKQTVAGIRNALEAGLFVMTNTTLLADNAGHVGETVDFLAEIGVPTVGVNALIHSGHGSTVGTGLTEASLGPLLREVRSRTDGYGQRLIWYTPTQYCAFDPVEAELGVKGCTAARTNMAVEPDGAVLPCQSFYRPVGNILRDPWEAIWNHELSIWLRERRYMAEACHACGLVAECGGGCPLSPPTGAAAAGGWIPIEAVAHIVEGGAQ